MVAIRHSIQTDKARKRVVSRLPFVFYVLGEKQKLPDERAENNVYWVVFWTVILRKSVDMIYMEKRCKSWIQTEKIPIYRLGKD